MICSYEFEAVTATATCVWCATRAETPMPRPAATRDNRSDILWVDTVHYNSRASDSSREIKHDIRPLPAMGGRLDKLVPVSFIYNDDRRN